MTVGVVSGWTFIMAFLLLWHILQLFWVRFKDVCHDQVFRLRVLVKTVALDIQRLPFFGDMTLGLDRHDPPIFFLKIMVLMLVWLNELFWAGVTVCSSGCKRFITKTSLDTLSCAGVHLHSLIHTRLCKFYSRTSKIYYILYKI